MANDTSPLAALLAQQPQMQAQFLQRFAGTPAAPAGFPQPGQPQGQGGFDFQQLLGLLGQLQGGQQQQGPQFGPIGALPGVQQPGFRPAAGLLGGANFKRLNPQQALRASQRRSGLLG